MQIGRLSLVPFCMQDYTHISAPTMSGLFACAQNKEPQRWEQNRLKLPQKCNIRKVQYKSFYETEICFSIPHLIVSLKVRGQSSY